MCLYASLTQCGAGLQAAGGQAAAVDEEAMPYRGEPLPPAALSPGALHLHSKTQVQSRVQKACSLETLVPVKRHNRNRPLPAMHRIDATITFSILFSWLTHCHLLYRNYWTFCSPGYLFPFQKMQEWIPWKIQNFMLAKNGFRYFEIICSSGVQSTAYLEIGNKESWISFICASGFFSLLDCNP